MKKLTIATGLALALLGLQLSTASWAAGITGGLTAKLGVHSPSLLKIANPTMASDTDEMMQQKMKESREMMNNIKPGKDDKSMRMMMTSMRMMMNDMDSAMQEGKITDEDRAMMTEMLDSMKVIMRGSEMMMPRKVWRSSPK